jgi:hypothetical protein
MIKIWVDDVRPAPDGYIWVRSVDNMIHSITTCEQILNEPIRIELLDLDHDAGDYAPFGGDYIEILNWLEATGRNYPIRIHSQNSVGIANMRRIIQRNGWKEVF